jgi:hypothetical protein
MSLTSTHNRRPAHTCEIGNVPFASSSSRSCNAAIRNLTLSKRRVLTAAKVACEQTRDESPHEQDNLAAEDGITINVLETRVVGMVACVPRFHVTTKRPQLYAPMKASPFPLLVR